MIGGWYYDIWRRACNMDLRPGGKTRFSGGGSRVASEEVIDLVRIITSMGDDWRETPTLTDKDRAFVDDMIYKAQNSPHTLWVNEKQLWWLRDLKDKVIA